MIRAIPFATISVFLLAACALPASSQIPLPLLAATTTKAPATGDLTSLLTQRREILRQMEKEIQIRRDSGVISGETVLKKVVELRRAELKFEPSASRRLVLRQEIVQMLEQLVTLDNERRRTGIDAPPWERDHLRLSLLDARIELLQEKSSLLRTKIPATPKTIP